MKKESIRYQLINYERNRELLQLVPHIRYLDLVIVFYGIIDEEENTSYGLLTWQGMYAMGLTEEETERLASENTPRDMPCVLDSLEKIVERILGKADLEPTGLPMYVLTNKQCIFGAACILYPNLLQRISGILGSDLYILPSSIHECILIPENAGADRKELEEIVREINRTQVPEAEILSDHVYIYRAKGDFISF